LKQEKVRKTEDLLREKSIFAVRRKSFGATLVSCGESGSTIAKLETVFEFYPPNSSNKLMQEAGVKALPILDGFGFRWQWFFGFIGKKVKGSALVVRLKEGQNHSHVNLRNPVGGQVHIVDQEGCPQAW
jgi:hypothetical protein